MSFDMQRLPPPPPPREKRAFYRWAIAYFVLGLAFGVLGWTLIFHKRVALGVFSILVQIYCNSLSNRNYIQFRNFQEVEDEQR